MGGTQLITKLTAVSSETNTVDGPPPDTAGTKYKKTEIFRLITGNIQFSLHFYCPTRDSIKTFLDIFRQSNTEYNKRFNVHAKKNSNNKNKIKCGAVQGTTFMVYQNKRFSVYCKY